MAEYGEAFSPSQARDCSDHISQEEEDEDHSRGSVGGGGASKTKKIDSKESGEMVLAEEVTRKPRGRPPGSKNKPKPPIVITRDSESAIKPVVLELSAGSNLIEMVSQFVRRRHVCLTVISCSGTVANVTLRHPISPGTTLTLHGPFNILSLTGTFLGSSSSSFAISLAGARGQVFGGIVAGKIIAASTIVLVAATFINPSFHRLAGEDEGAEEVKPGSVIGGSESGTTTMSMSVYNVAAPRSLNCQIPHDILPWTPPRKSFRHRLRSRKRETALMVVSVVAVTAVSDMMLVSVLQKSHVRPGLAECKERVSVTEGFLVMLLLLRARGQWKHSDFNHNEWGHLLSSFRWSAQPESSQACCQPHLIPLVALVHDWFGIIHILRVSQNQALAIPKLRQQMWDTKK
ncbi:hypothetical protein HHK36_019646 [Tetracentron sinense]|uniref:PPC domain-containing protein n=1 Tax=Tetracentron sinense TaxID=13715 RepID=A0A834YZH7_TETSI|nr:hypothetical protein HHK36_019646 [Tetracentron sinense]